MTQFEYPTNEAERSVCGHEDSHSVIYAGESTARVQRIEVRIADSAGQPAFDRVTVNLLDGLANQIEAERENVSTVIQDNYSVVADALRSEALQKAFVAA